VGLSCQRLDFLSAHRLRVPRCEILLPSSGAKGTVRAGNFSQIANVLQSGGDEGMWTFERYQRWMDQVSDWVRPSQAAPTRGPGEGNLVQRTAGFGTVTKPSSGAPVQTAPLGGKGGVSKPLPNRPARPISGPADEVFDVPAEEMDLAQLAELAKKVVERKP
jgi:twitching motility protein PilT